MDALMMPQAQPAMAPPAASPEQVLMQLLAASVAEEPEEESDYEEPIPQEEATFLKSMTDKEIIDFTSNFHSKSDLQRRKHEKIWEANWDAYNQEYDWSEKDKWQAQEAPPRVFMMTERAALATSQGLFSPREWFDAETFNPYADDIALKVDMAKRGLNYYLKHQDVQFTEAFETSLKNGLLAEKLNMKLGWKYLNRVVVKSDGIYIDKVGRPDIRPVDSFNLWLDSSGNNVGILEQIKMPIWEYRQKVQDGIYKDLPDSCIQSYHNLEDTTKARMRRGQDAGATEPVEEVLLWEYWGNVWNKEGELCYRNVYLTILNKKYLVQGPDPNPYWHGKSPYLSVGLLNVPFSVYHKSVIGVVSGITTMLVDVLNMIFDGFLMSMMKMYEADMDVMEDPDQIDSGIWPGKIWKRREGAMNTQSQAMKEVFTNYPPSHVFMLYQLLDRETQFGSGVTETMTGLPRLRGRSSALEVAQRSAETNNLFVGIANRIEKLYLEPMLDMLFMLLLQYQTDYPDMEFALAVFQDRGKAAQFMRMKAEERFAQLAGDFKFTVNGLSSLMSKKEDIEKASFLFKLLTKVPPEMMGGRQINWDRIIARLVDAIGWDSFEIMGPKQPMPPREALPTPAQQPQPVQQPTMGTPVMQQTAPPVDIRNILGQQAAPSIQNIQGVV